MNSHGEIDRFDLKAGKVPSYPFFVLPDIAARARRLLSPRSAEQIASAANSIDWVITEFFKANKEQEIERLRDVLTRTYNWRRITSDEEAGYREATRFFDWHADWECGDGTWEFNQDLESDLLTLMAKKMGKVNALIECIDWWDDIGGEGFPDASPAEVFAVLSLSLLSEAIAWIGYCAEGSRGAFRDAGVPKSIAALARANVGEVRTILSLAGDSAISAMRAACYAEHLHTVSGLHRAYEHRDMVRQEEERKRKSMLGERLNVERHRVTNQAKAIAIEEWNRDRSRFPSAERAGLAISDWLQDKGFEFEPRTVTGWIRAHAKQIGLRLR
jgi:hypothetical protein